MSKLDNAGFDEREAVLEEVSGQLAELFDRVPGGVYLYLDHDVEQRDAEDVAGRTSRGGTGKGSLDWYAARGKSGPMSNSTTDSSGGVDPTAPTEPAPPPVDPQGPTLLPPPPAVPDISGTELDPAVIAAGVTAGLAAVAIVTAPVTVPMAAAAAAAGAVAFVLQSALEPPRVLAAEEEPDIGGGDTDGDLT